MITIDEYNKRVNENTLEYIRQQEVNSYDIKKYHGFDVCAGELSRCKLSSKTHDILCAVVLGFLPILDKRVGHDAIRLDDTIFTPVELKTSYADESKFIKTKKDIIYSTTPGKIINGNISSNDTTSLKSCYNASYSIKDNITQKGIDTYLVLMDSRNDDIIDCFIITSANMISYLDGRTLSASGGLQIKLAIFLKIGKRSSSHIPVIGFETWSNNLLPLLPLVRVVGQKSMNAFGLDRCSSV